MMWIVKLITMGCNQSEERSRFSIDASQNQLPAESVMSLPRPQSY